MRLLFSFLILITITGCNGIKNQYKIEKKAPIDLKEAHFERWVSGIKGGGSGINVFLQLDTAKSSNEIELKGIYFRKKYAVLENQGDHAFRAYIKGGPNWKKIETITMGPEKQKKEEVTETKEEFPFQLNENEAVISFLHRGQLKYTKIQLKKKQGLRPM